MKKNGDLNENEILKYHDIIQDLSNMILIYENFFFKKKVKPKNNNELFTYLIVQYINNRIKKIKLNALINLIIYKESLPKKKVEKNRIITRKYNDYNDEDEYDFEENKKRRKPYVSARNKIKTKKEDEE